MPPLFPFALAIYFPLFLYSQNQFRYSPGVVAFPLAGILFVSVGVWVIWSLLFKDRVKGALFLALNLMGTFSYGTFHIFANQASWGETISPHTSLKLYLMLATALHIFLAGSLYKNSLTLSLWVSLLNRICLFLLVFPLFALGANFFRDRSASEENLEKSPREKLVPDEWISGSTPARPDIYHILLDAYPRADVLEQIYGFSNKRFMDGLKDRGFLIADSSLSNYSSTDLSVASLFNLAYLQDMNLPLAKKSRNWKVLDEVRDNALGYHIIKKLGYRIIHVPHGWENSQSAVTDVFVNPPPGNNTVYLNEYQNGLLQMTPLPYFLNKFARKNLNPDLQHRKRVLHSLDYLSKAYRENGPKYIFCHILSPHTPAVFNIEGQPVTHETNMNKLRGKNPRLFKKALIEQIQYLNLRILDILDVILEREGKDVIILLHSDHGESILEFQKTPEFYWQRHANLTAIRLPGGVQDSAFYPNLTPVNYLPFLLNASFDMKIPFHPDKIFYSNRKHPFDFTEVTASLANFTLSPERVRND